MMYWARQSLMAKQIFARSSGVHLAMSGSGVTYCDEELKFLLRLLKGLPDSIPTGETHNFLGYVPSPQKVVDTGCIRSVVSHSLELSFGARRTPAGETIIVVFKSRGPALEEVVTVLRNHITGNAGANLLLTLWVDDLTTGAVHAIEASGGRVSGCSPFICRE
jgi:hypothetical protein